MAWGMFCGIPCPVKIWDEKARGSMLRMFPLIGAMTGAVQFLIWLFLELIGAPEPAAAGIIAVLPFFLTGSIHIDGYMDVCDAVFSRRDQERRREILKDPGNGSFAMAGLVIYGILYYSGILAILTSEDQGADWLMSLVIVIPVAVRCASAWSVACCRPMETSQYNPKEGEWTTDRKTAVSSIVLLAVSMAIYAAIVFACVPGDPGASGLSGASAAGALESGIIDPGMIGACILLIAIPLIAFAAAMICGALCRRNLGGMNGDISGMMITVGEAAGILAAGLAAGIV